VARYCSAFRSGGSNAIGNRIVFACAVITMHAILGIADHADRRLAALLLHPELTTARQLETFRHGTLARAVVAPLEPDV
jgi:hypothetical protein